jgi:hypothetical protein
VLEELDADHAVVCFWWEFVVDDVTCYYCEVGKTFGLGDGVDVLFLGA